MLKNNKLHILFVSTEAEPFVGVGGLGAVMHALPRALTALGHDVRLMIPRYLKINEEEWNIKMELEGLEVPTDNENEPKTIICNVKRADPDNAKGAPVTAYFLENMEYYEQRSNVYGYADDPIRWALLCRGVLEFLRVSKWTPDVIVTSDWQTGILSNYLKTLYQNDGKLRRIATVMSIHNLAHQGSVNFKFLPETDFDDGYSLLPAMADPQLLKINGMRRAIIHADAINTVSQTYAQEIMTPAYGAVLDELLRKKKDSVVGILNGLDYSLWNPETDPVFPNHFSAGRLDERKKNKRILQERFELPQDDSAFVVGIVARMSPQKGIDLLETTIQSLLQSLPIQFVVLGEGETRIMEIFLNTKTLFPEQVSAKFIFDGDLPHLIFAGSDAALVPSRFEPSGLTQMEAMAYGCIPIVRRTGGLADTVEDYDPGKGTGTGFVFEKIEPQSLLIAITRAYQSFKHEQSWKKLQIRAMQKDFSWENSAKQYVELFKKAVKINNAKNS